MISRAASRTSSERSSSTSPRPSISAFSFSRVRSDAGILSIGVLLRGGRSPNRTSLVRLIGRGSTPTLFPASLGLHRGTGYADKGPSVGQGSGSSRGRVRLAGCHFNFAHTVTFQPCADTKSRITALLEIGAVRHPNIDRARE